MLKLTKLRTYRKHVRTNRRSGDQELEAIDPRSKPPLEEIKIPHYGYILKPNEVYVAEVDNPGSQAYVEENFTDHLSSIGVTCKILEDDCLLMVQRPVRIFKDMELFYEDKK